MYTLEFSKLAEKQFYKLPKEDQKRIGNALERIRIRPEAYVRRLVGESFYRLRVGDYRIIIDIQNQKLIIFVIRMGRRENVYD